MWVAVKRVFSSL